MFIVNVGSDERTMSHDHLVKVFGLERSGTNYFEWLLKANCPRIRVITNQLGWKHAAPIPPLIKVLTSGASSLSSSEQMQLYSHRSFQDQQFKQEVESLLAANKLRIAAVVKNPYNWYASIVRYYSRAGLEMGPEQLHRWNQTNRSYRELQKMHPAQVMIIQYEELLTDMQQSMKKIAQHFGLLLNADLCDLPFRIDAGFRVSKQLFPRERYVDGQHLDRYSDNGITKMNRILNRHLLREFNYILRPVWL